MTFKNMSNSLVYIILPDCNYRKELRPNGLAKLTQEQMNAFDTDPGCLEMLENGFLCEVDETAPVVRRKIAEMLSPIAVSSTSDEKKVVITQEEIKTFFDGATIEQFTKALLTGSTATKELISSYAVKVCENNPGRVALLKKYCDIDPIQSYALNNAQGDVE